MGLQTYTKSYRNFNILSKDADGQFVSRFVVATYTLTLTDYIENTLFHILVRGQEFGARSRRSPRVVSYFRWWTHPHSSLGDECRTALPRRGAAQRHV